MGVFAIWRENSLRLAIIIKKKLLLIRLIMRYCGKRASDPFKGSKTLWGFTLLFM